jgi:hypothetical protein
MCDVLNLVGVCWKALQALSTTTAVQHVGQADHSRHWCHSHPSLQCSKRRKRSSTTQQQKTARKFKRALSLLRALPLCMRLLQAAIACVGLLSLADGLTRCSSSITCSSAMPRALHYGSSGALHSTVHCISASSRYLLHCRRIATCCLAGHECSLLANPVILQ